MTLDFVKMHGLGNDFVLIDGRALALDDLPGLSKKLLDRRFGIGADQLLILLDSDKADFRMRIFNPDGGEIEMCGNGVRCLARYIWDRGLSDREGLRIETLAGIIKPQRAGGLIRVDMGTPLIEAKDIPLKIEGRTFTLTTVSMGNPHAVIFVDNAAQFPVSYYGPLIENNPLFPQRTNVEFVEVIGPDEIIMRVWERGAGRTMACGTGASASAAASFVKGLTAQKTRVLLEAGELIVEWPGKGSLYLTGPAEEVFKGRINI